MSFNAGWAFGPATAGILAAHGFFWLFAGDAATSALFGVVALAFLPDTAAASRSTCSWMEATRTLARDRRLHQVLFASICMALIFFQMNSTYGLAVVHLGYSPATYGALISLNGALVVLFELPLTTVTRRFPALRVVAFGFFVAGLGFALNAFAATVPALAACIVLFTLGEMCAMPVASAYVAELSPSNMRGRYMGTYGLTWTLAQVLGPGLGMRFYSASPTAYWLSGGALGLIAASILLARRPAPSGAASRIAA
jgi:MFS family permease